MRVFVLDTNCKPLDPCHPARSRELLKKGKAAVFRRYPFTIILKDRTLENSTVHPHRVKIDPGSKTTGFAVLNESTNHVVWAAELEHRGEQIHSRMQDRASLRRNRRNRKTRYRKPRFLNRNPEKCIICGKNARHGHKTCRHHAKERPKTLVTPRGLPPSLESRVANTITWTKRLIRCVPVAAISMELVRFDLQKIENPEIQGVEYQQGAFAGYELREYLLLKFGHQCVYCHGTSGDPVLEVEHTIPKSRGGSDRVSNLVIACHTCNQKKGAQTAEEFGHPEVAARAKQPLRDAAAVNSTRWALWNRLQNLGLPLETGTGGQTKYNRTRLGLPKTHWLDAACVGASTPDQLMIEKGSAFRIKATGHGKRQRCGTDKYGFPVRYVPAVKSYMGFRTGDLVQAHVLQGKYAGTHVGRIVIRHRPSFRLNGFDVHPKYLRLLQQADGYAYAAAPLQG